MNLKNVDFILASASPRRKKLLEQAGCKFKVVVSDVNESGFHQGQREVAEYAKILALAKAENVAAKYSDKFVIAADTVADFDGEIIGKPACKTDAERIIRKLFSRPHEVITAVAIVNKTAGINIVDADRTTVYPKKLTETQIAAYLDTGRWKGKAGAYGIQQIGDKFVEKIDGSISNVVGMPMELFEKMLLRITKSRQERSNDC